MPDRDVVARVPGAGIEEFDRAERGERTVYPSFSPTAGYSLVRRSEEGTPGLAPAFFLKAPLKEAKKTNV